MTTTAFALTLKPVWFCVVEAGTSRRIDWRHDRSKFLVRIDRAPERTFATEYEAWEHVRSEFPSAIDQLRCSEMVAWRGYALRAEMMLTLGRTRFDEMTNDLHKSVHHIFGFALDALAATKVSKAVPKVTRMATSRAVSWLDVRTNVEMPYIGGRVLLSVRCLPSPVDENTWSVRFRVPANSDSAIVEVQHRFEEFVTNMRYQGITIKDVQNGTCLDL